MNSLKKNSGRNRSQRQYELSQAFAQRLREARHTLSMSQETLGKALEVSFQMIQKYEKGECQMTPAQVILAAETLNISLTYLLTGVYSDSHKAPLHQSQVKLGLMNWQKVFEKDADPKSQQISHYLLSAWLALMEPVKT